MRLSISLGACLLLAQSIYALRNPFQPASGRHAYALVGVGIVHDERFAVLCIDGISYTARKRDVVAGHTIAFICDGALMLKDEQGNDVTLRLK